MAATVLRSPKARVVGLDASSGVGFRTGSPFLSNSPSKLDAVGVVDESIDDHDGSVWREL
jgi:hypothetical protein